MGRSGRRRNGVRALLAVALTAFVAVLAGGGARRLMDGRTERAEVTIAKVHRADIEQTLTVIADVDGARQTEIDCELEAVSEDGSRMPGEFTIIEIIPNGTRVKKGDMLCRFDASKLEEAARRQAIEVERAVAEHRQAELDLEASRAGLLAYRDGEAVQLAEGMRGRVALARADLTRAVERLAYSRRMQKLGYVSPDAVYAEEKSVLTQRNTLGQSERELKIHTIFTVPKTVRDLQGQVQANEERLSFAALQRKNSEGRLKHLRGLVEKCTVRAPHDGMAVHFNVYDDDLSLREGSKVHQGQPLFYLPELNKLIANVMLHESIAHRVKVGMPVQVTIPAVSRKPFVGKLTYLAPLPIRDWRAWTEFLQFPAKVTIDNPPPNVLPSMSAELRIVTGRRKDVLVVPTEAVTHEGGREFCYVDGDGGLERRPVRVTRADRERLEVLDGLAEGERVVIRPDSLRTSPEPLPDIRDRSPEGRETRTAGRPSIALHARGT